MMRTPDGQGIELDRFHTPKAIRTGPADAPVNELGIRRMMFVVDDIDEVLGRLLGHGAGLVGVLCDTGTLRTGSPTSGGPRALSSLLQRSPLRP